MMLKLQWSECSNQVVTRFPDIDAGQIESAVLLSDNNDRKLTLHYFTGHGKKFVRLSFNESEAVVLTLSE